MYTLIVTLTAKPGREAELRALLSGLVAPSRAEAGCVNYDLMIDPARPGEFVFYENWKSRADHVLHDGTPHILAARQGIKDCTAGPNEKRELLMVSVMA